MEKNVLQSFIENSTCSISMRQCLASNSILDWFGRSVKGRDKISQYFRDQINGEYEHHFSTVIESVPFEEKTSHFQTKSMPPENQIKLASSCYASTSQSSTSSSHNHSHSSSESSLITPPKKQIDTIANELKLPPPLLQGRRFLDLSEDECDGSDISESDLSPCISPQKTSTPKGGSGSSDTSPLLEDSLVSFAETNDSEDEDHATAKAEPIKKKTKIEHQPVLVIVKSHYSDLKYLEAVGLLRIRRQKKHRGTIPELNQSMNQSTEVVNNNEMSPSSAFGQSTGPTDCWERRTKLKISYRINELDKNVQFALILYEHLTKTTRTRRNLLLDFHEMAKTRQQQHKTVTTMDGSPLTPDKASNAKKRTSHLKRQLRL